MPSMFNLFQKKYKSGVLVVSEAELWDRLEGECTRREFFDAQGDEHCQIDMRLVTKIEEYLVPIIGQWENSDAWFHQMDFYGDGIRALSFSLSVFRNDFIDYLQSLLVGEHEPFCILCKIHENLGGIEDTKIGTLVIFSNRLMLSRRVAQLLTKA